jgi:uncharacterized protein (DUF433 family)
MARILEEEGNNMRVDWHDYIVSTPEIICGKPRINGTRLSVSLILGFLAAGYSAEDIMKEYPGLKAEQIAACLDYARDLAEFVVEAS